MQLASDFAFYEYKNSLAKSKQIFGNYMIVTGKLDSGKNREARLVNATFSFYAQLVILRSACQRFFQPAGTQVRWSADRKKDAPRWHRQQYAAAEAEQFAIEAELQDGAP